MLSRLAFVCNDLIIVHAIIRNMFSLRYSRMSALKEIGISGLETLQKSTISIIGMGATGSSAAELFARNGAGKIKIADPDTVDISNLHRQVLYSEEDVGNLKVESAKRKLSAINNSLAVETNAGKIDNTNVDRFCSGSSIIIDGTDNMESRRVLNKYSARSGIPWVFTSAIGTAGQIKLIVPGRSACLQCMGIRFDTPDMRCEDVGVLASAPHMVGSIAWTLAIRYLIRGELKDEIIYLDASLPEIVHIKTQRDRACEVCGNVS